MLTTTLGVARKFGAKAAAGVGALALSGAVMAQEAGGDAGAEIVSQVNQSLTTGSNIAKAVVLGLFVIFGIKLLWRSK